MTFETQLIIFSLSLIVGSVVTTAVADAILRKSIGKTLAELDKELDDDYVTTKDGEKIHYNEDDQE